MAKKFLLKNNRTGKEFTETEAGLKIRQNHPSLMEDIVMIGEIDPKTGEVDRTSASELIEKINQINVTNDAGKSESTEENPDNQSEERSEEGGNSNTKEEGKGKRKNIFGNRKN